MNLNATILAQMLIFALVIWVAMKFLWPEITGSIQERAKKIAEGLAAAERGAEGPGRGRSPASRSWSRQRANARWRWNTRRRRGRARLSRPQSKARRPRPRGCSKMAQAQVALETQKARDELRHQVAALAVSGAEKIIEREIDARTHAQLLDKLAAGL